MNKIATVTADESGTIEGEFGTAVVTIKKDEIVNLAVTSHSDSEPFSLDLFLIHDNLIEISSDGMKIFFNSGEYFMTVNVVMDPSSNNISDLTTNSV